MGLPMMHPMVHQNVEIKMQARGLADGNRTAIFVPNCARIMKCYLLLLCFCMSETSFGTFFYSASPVR